MPLPESTTTFIGRASFRIGSVHEAYAELSASRVEVSKTFEPNQISPGSTFGPDTWYPSTGASYDMVYDALADYFGAGQLNYGERIAYRWRCIACGPRA